mmetsp:Transcript_37290/g.69464  ORF Transcript_37290/g.69464 Transcript_37290/m.69464 type:complete len:1028 (+) Transcript_37290:205-3288(+)
MFNNNPTPPRSSRSSKGKSPRGSTPGKINASRPDIHSYIQDIAQRKGSYALEKLRAHPLSPQLIGAVPSPDNEMDYRLEDSDDDVPENAPATHDRYRHMAETATVLFENSPGMKLANEAVHSRFREGDYSPPTFRGPSNIVLTHNVAKRDRRVQFVIREHNESGITSFSMHVQGLQQRYSFHIPPIQELRVLLQLWDRHPAYRDHHRVGQYIIKSTSVSFSGRRIDSIIFKDDAFSLKIKREAITLLSSMATIIQKNVRRYLVQQTYARYIQHIARHSLPSNQNGSPITRRHQLSESRVYPTGSGKKPFSPITSPQSRGGHLNRGWLSHDNDDNDKEIMEDAIRAQREAEAAVQRPRITYASPSGSPARKDESAIRRTVNFNEEEITPVPKLPPELTHEEKVQTLLKERQEAEAKVRADKLSKKKEERHRLKAERAEEKKKKKNFATTEAQAQTKGKVGASIMAMSIASKLKKKAVKNMQEAEEENSARNKMLEDEHEAGIKSLRNAALQRKNSSFKEGERQISYKEFQMKQAREREIEKSGQHHSSAEDFTYDDSNENNVDTRDDASGGKDGLVEDSRGDELSAGELFQRDLKLNENKEKKLLDKSSAMKKHVAEVEKGNFNFENKEKSEKSEKSDEIFVVVNSDDRALKKFDDKLPPHKFDEYFHVLRESMDMSMSADQVMFIFDEMQTNKFFNQSTIHAMESDSKLMWWVDALFTAMVQCKHSKDIALVGLKIAAMFPYDRFPVAENRISFCKILNKVLLPHINDNDAEDFCAQVLHYGTKFTSKKVIQNLDQVVDNEGLEMIVKVLLKFGQQRDLIGNAPKVVSLCLKYVRNICIMSTPHAQARLMAAGVGSCLVKLLVFYRTDEGVVAPICRSVACFIKNPSYISNFASHECLQLYILILKTNPMNKTISKMVGVLLIELYSADPSAMKDVFLKCDMAKLLNDLLVTQMRLSSRFSLSVIECNIMMCSYFVIQVTVLKEGLLEAGIIETLTQYQQNQQNFGHNIDVVIEKCLKHLRDPVNEE